jgi:hypothetical protein
MTDTAGAPTPEDIFDDANLNGDTDDTTASSPTELEELTARQRTQQRLIQARTSAQAAAARARSSATLPSRRNKPAEDSSDAPAISIADRAQAYRTHIVSAAAAVALLLVVIARRGAKRKPVDDTVDLGEWRLHAEAVGE